MSDSQPQSSGGTPASMSSVSPAATPPANNNTIDLNSQQGATIISQQQGVGVSQGGIPQGLPQGIQGVQVVPNPVGMNPQYVQLYNQQMMAAQIQAFQAFQNLQAMNRPTGVGPKSPVGQPQPSPTGLVSPMRGIPPAFFTTTTMGAPMKLPVSVPMTVTSGIPFTLVTSSASKMTCVTPSGASVAKPPSAPTTPVPHSASVTNKMQVSRPSSHPGQQLYVGQPGISPIQTISQAKPLIGTVAPTSTSHVVHSSQSTQQLPQQQQQQQQPQGHTAQIMTNTGQVITNTGQVITNPAVLNQLQAMGLQTTPLPVATATPGSHQQFIGSQSPTILASQPVFIRATGPLQSTPQGLMQGVVSVQGGGATVASSPSSAVATPVRIATPRGVGRGGGGNVTGIGGPRPRGPKGINMAFPRIKAPKIPGSRPRGRPPKISTSSQALTAPPRTLVRPIRPIASSQNSQSAVPIAMPTAHIQQVAPAVTGVTMSQHHQVLVTPQHVDLGQHQSLPPNLLLPLQAHPSSSSSAIHQHQPASSPSPPTLTPIQIQNQNGEIEKPVLKAEVVVPPTIERGGGGGGQAVAMEMNGSNHHQHHQEVLPPTGEKQKAIVKPQVLTHIIDGFVIQEAAEPFPVQRSSLLTSVQGCDRPAVTGQPEDDQARNKKDMEDQTQQPMLKCEFCGKVAPANKFRRSKRFCSMACAKRYNVGCTRRLGLFKKGDSLPHQNPTKQLQKKKKLMRLKKGWQRTKTDRMGYTSLPRAREKVQAGHVTESGEDQSSSISAQDESSSTTPPSTPRDYNMETSEPRTHPSKWSVQEVYDFICSMHDCAEYADQFRSEEIDGQALLLLKEDHLMSAMNVKLGPALKICARINQLKAEDS